MANQDPNLKLHLVFNQVGASVAPDASGNGNAGALAAVADLARDPYFGSVLRFDGASQYVTVKNNASLQIVGDQTLEMWIRPAVLDARRNPFYKSFGGEAAVTIEPSGQASYYYGQAGADADPYQGFSTTSSLVAGEWSHLAIARDLQAKTLTWYVDGVLDAQVAASFASAKASAADLLIGKGYAGSFKGDIASVRLYDRALTQDEVRRDMDEDQTALAAFRSTHPLGFCLCDQDEQNVLYILDESKKSSYHFEAMNDTRLHLNFPAMVKTGEQATAANSIFQIVFRPGVLEETSLAKIAVSEAGWKVGYAKGADGSIALFLATEQALAIGPGAKTSLALQNVEVAAGPGSRGTRVAFRYQNLLAGNETAPVSGVRMQHLSIINERGRKRIPLRLDFNGSSSVVNANGVANSLTLRIYNTLVRDPAYPDRSSIRFNLANHQAPSKLIVSFDTEDKNGTKPWAIASTDQARQFQVFYPGGTQVQIAGAQGESPEWIFPVNVGQLEAERYLEVSLTNIVSSLPNGSATLYLRYENIPGYRDGTLEATIEKSPLFFANSSVSMGTNVSIGALAIRAQDNTDELIFLHDSHGALKWHLNFNGGGLNIAESLVADYRLFFQKGGNVGVGTNQPSAKLHVNGSLRSASLSVDGALTPSAGNSETQGIMFPKDPGGGASDAAWIRYYARSGESTTLEIGTSNDPDDHIALMPSGNVGIGTNAPTQKLDVRGRILAQSLQIGGTAIGERELQVLARLASGSLEFDLYNTAQQEFLYAADYKPFDDDRRRIFTWRRKNERVSQGRWRLSYPA